MCCRFYMLRREETEPLIERINRRPTVPPGMKTEGEIFLGDIVPVIACDRNARPSAFAMQWGFHLPGSSRLVFNARSETAALKPLFSESMRLHRCAVPAALYYEWDQAKVKHAIRAADGPLTYLAAIYRMEGARPVFTVLTRDPVPETAAIHPRMPVILRRESVDAWIAPAAVPEEVLRLPPVPVIVAPA